MFIGSKKLSLRINDAESAWQALELENQTGGYKSILLSHLNVEVRVGLMYPEKLPALLVGFYDWNPRRSIDAVQLQGLELDCVQLHGSDANWLGITKTKEGSYDLFLRIVEDLFETIEKSSSLGIQECLLKIAERFYAWREFLKRKSIKLDRSGQIGLFGELIVFKALNFSGLDANKLVDGWVGPKRGIHDFVFSSTTVEVKTCSNNDKIIYVDSVDQLSPVDGCALVLAIVQIEQSTIGISLADLVNLCRGLFSEDSFSRSEFDNLLLKLGYLTADESKYSDQYVVTKTDFYPVLDDFPRLKRGDIPTEVYDASYQMSLARYSGEKITENELFDLLRR